MFKAEGIDAVVLKDAIDQPFISQLEQKNENVKFVRIDADLNDSFTEEISEDELKDATEKLTETFKKALNRDQLDVKVQKIKDDYCFRRKPSYAGYDEDVWYVRYGSCNVWWFR